MNEKATQPTARHTDGPWFVFGNGHCVGGPLTDRLPAETQTAGIAMCGMKMRLPEENAANARLVAAAPELLAALTDLLDCDQLDRTDTFCEACYRHAPKNDEGVPTGPIPHEADCIIAVAVAAIDKATGAQTR